MTRRDIGIRVAVVAVLVLLVVALVIARDDSEPVDQYRTPSPTGGEASP